MTQADPIQSNAMPRDETDEVELELTFGRTDLMMLDELIKLYRNEPEKPDLDKHSGAQLDEIARAHNAWARSIGAWRTLLAVRLVNTAIRERSGGEIR